MHIDQIALSGDLHGGASGTVLGLPTQVGARTYDDSDGMGVQWTAGLGYAVSTSGELRAQFSWARGTADRLQVGTVADLDHFFLFDDDKSMGFGLGYRQYLGGAGLRVRPYVGIFGGVSRVDAIQAEFTVPGRGALYPSHVASGFQIRLPWDLPHARLRASAPATLDVEGRTWPLQIVRHARARRYVLRMTDSGGLRLTVPRRASVDAGLRFVRTQGSWIAREHLRREARTNTWGAGATVWFRGAHTPVEGVRVVAAEELPPRCQALAAQHGATVTRVSIRNQRSRWGSCSTRGTIALNWRLVLMPPFVSDYIILHELMHLRQPNHSRAFWREVAIVCPDWREAERWLREHGRDLL